MTTLSVVIRQSDDNKVIMRLYRTSGFFEAIGIYDSEDRRVGLCLVTSRSRLMWDSASLSLIPKKDLSVQFRNMEKMPTTLPVQRHEVSLGPCTANPQVRRLDQ